MADRIKNDILAILKEVACPRECPKDKPDEWATFHDRYAYEAQNKKYTDGTEAACYVCLGYGQYGSVFSCVDAAGAKYAAKVIPVRSASDAEKLRREIRILQHLAAGADAGLPHSDRIVQIKDQFVQIVDPSVDFWRNKAGRVQNSTGVRVVLVMEIARPVGKSALVEPNASGEPPCSTELAQREVDLGYQGSNVDLAAWTGHGKPYVLVREVLKQMLEGLVFCHGCGEMEIPAAESAGDDEMGRGKTGTPAAPTRSVIMQRDIKPDNVLVVEHVPLPGHATLTYPRVKLSDFGLAKEVIQTSATAVATSQEHTIGVGTRNYMAPELFIQSAAGSSTARYSTKVDAFACGCALYTMVTGTLASETVQLGFTGRFSDSKLRANFPMEVLDGGKEVPSEQRYLLQKLTEADQAKRWDVATALAFLEADADRRTAVIRGEVHSDYVAMALDPSSDLDKAKEMSAVLAATAAATSVAMVGGGAAVSPAAVGGAGATSTAAGTRMTSS